MLGSPFLRCVLHGKCYSLREEMFESVTSIISLQPFQLSLVQMLPPYLRKSGIRKSINHHTCKRINPSESSYMCHLESSNLLKKYRTFHLSYCGIIPSLKVCMLNVDILVDDNDDVFAGVAAPGVHVRATHGSHVTAPSRCLFTCHTTTSTKLQCNCFVSTTSSNVCNHDNSQRLCL